MAGPLFINRSLSVSNINEKKKKSYFLSVDISIQQICSKLVLKAVKHYDRDGIGGLKRQGFSQNTIKSKSRLFYAVKMWLDSSNCQLYYSNFCSTMRSRIKGQRFDRRKCIWVSILLYIILDGNWIFLHILNNCVTSRHSFPSITCLKDLYTIIYAFLVVQNTIKICITQPKWWVWNIQSILLNVAMRTALLNASNATHRNIKV